MFPIPTGHEYQCVIPMALWGAAGDKYLAPIRQVLRLLIANQGLAVEVVRGLRRQYFRAPGPGGRCGRNIWRLRGFRCWARSKNWRPSGGPRVGGAGIHGSSCDCLASWLRGLDLGWRSTARNRAVRNFLKLHAWSRFPAVGAGGDNVPVCGPGGLPRIPDRRWSGISNLPGNLPPRDLRLGLIRNRSRRVLAARGFLKHDRGRLTESAKLPGRGKLRSTR